MAYGYKKFKDYESRSIDELTDMLDNKEWTPPEFDENTDEPDDEWKEKDTDHMTLFVDLDGVIRNTIDVLKTEPQKHTEWDWGPDCQKQFDENLEDSLFVFPTVNRSFLEEVMSAALRYDTVRVTFLTCQPNEKQKKFTDLFVCHVIDRMQEMNEEFEELDLGKISVGYVDKAEDKLFWLSRHPHSVLIDDYPLFPDKIRSNSMDSKLLERVFLFKQPWNEARTAEHRYLIEPTRLGLAYPTYEIQAMQFSPRRASFDKDFIWRFLRKLNQD